VPSVQRWLDFYGLVAEEVLCVANNMVSYHAFPRFVPYKEFLILDSFVLPHVVPSDNPTYIPSHMVGKGSPMKFNVPTYELDLDYARQRVFSRLQAFVPVGFIADFDAVLSDMPMTTSPGFPHSTRFPSKEQMLLDPQARSILMEEVTERKREFYYSTSFDKGELIKRTKESARRIEGAEIGLLMRMSRVCKGFNKSIEVSGQGLPSYLGLDVHHNWWRYAGPASNCSHLLALDVSSFDTCVPLSAYECVRSLRAAFSPDEVEELDVLYSNVLKKNVIDDHGYVWVCEHGTQTGQPNTAHDNTLCMWLLVEQFFSTLSDDDYPDFAAYYGDDVVLGWDGCPSFSIPYMVHWFAEIGMNLKCASEFLSHTEVDFLSHVSVKTSYGLVPRTIRADKLWESMRWIENRSPLALNSLSRCVQLRNELVLTDHFQDATFLCNRLLFQLVHYSDMPVYQACARMMYTEDELLRLLTGEQYLNFCWVDSLITNEAQHDYCRQIEKWQESR